MISQHPEYMSKFNDWIKFRYVWEGGESFRDKYLEKYSDRESDTDFNLRARITPIPAFAAGAVVDIKNAIFQRMSDIVRSGGGRVYQEVIGGASGGVDLKGSSINYFIGNQVLDELLFMGKVGVYVDMAKLEGNESVTEVKGLHPYFYVYKVEDILNWRLAMVGDYYEFDLLLLRERVLTYDDYGLPQKDNFAYRLITRENGKIKVQFLDANGVSDSTPIILNMARIPFVLFELTQSLLQNIADHQIALLNLESSDVIYGLKSNYPFYVEQQNKMVSPHLKSDEDDNEIEVGGTLGRCYPIGANPPAFINPSSEPMTISMAKQKALKEDIRTLVQLALSTIQPRFASAESKQLDERGLESGLSFIGLVLEHGERRLANLFADYLNNNDEPATISYPDRYSLKSDEERIKEADELYRVALKLPSQIAQKELTKIIVKKILETKVQRTILDTILKEIDTAPYNTTDPELIYRDIENGVVSTETASQARGYDKGEAKEAEEDHLRRVVRIKEAQTSDPGARGVYDESGEPIPAGEKEKELSQSPDVSDIGKKGVRGKAK